jgi:hypothetical protein
MDPEYPYTPPRATTSAVADLARYVVDHATAVGTVVLDPMLVARARTELETPAPPAAPMVMITVRLTGLTPDGQPVHATLAGPVILSDGEWLG